MGNDLKQTLLIEKEKLELKLKLSQLVAGILLKSKHCMGKHRENSSSLEYNTAESLVSRLLDDNDVISSLVSSKFLVVSRISDTREIFDMIESISEEASSELKELKSDIAALAYQYEQINGSIRYEYKENYSCNVCYSFILNLLLGCNDYEMLQKLFTSDKIGIETKKEMYKMCFELDKEKTAKAFEKLYYNNVVFRSEHLQEKLSLVLKEIAESRCEENNYDFTHIITGKYSSYDEQRKAQRDVQVLIDMCFVDSNAIDFLLSPSVREKYGFRKEEEVRITSAAQAYRRGNFDIGNYLYSLQDLKTMNSKKIEDSDIVIMCEICENQTPLFLIRFIKEKDLLYTPKNFIFIMNILMHKQLDNMEYISTSEKEEIIALFLEKSKKEDLEEIKLLIKQFLNVTSREVVKERRQAVVACLRKDLECLLGEVPGKMNVGEAHTKRLKMSLENHE